MPKWQPLSRPVSAPSQAEAMQSTTVDLLRHGVCEGENTLRGVTDAALLPQGKTEMQAALTPGSKWDCVITSPLRRCHNFAREFCDRQNIPLNVDKRWQEIDFGEWDGGDIGELFRNFPEQANLYYTQPDQFTPPRGESVKEAKARVLQAFDDLLTQHKGKHVLVIQHGGPIRLLLSHILNIPLNLLTRIFVPYACLSQIIVYHSLESDVPVLISHNTRTR